MQNFVEKKKKKKIVAQISSATFEVKDDVGNKGVCTLVAKEAEELDNNEMSVKGYVDYTYVLHLF